MQGRQRAFLCEMGTGTRSVTERFWLLALVVGTLGVLVGVLVLVGGTVLGAVVRAVGRAVLALAVVGAVAGTVFGAVVHRHVSFREGVCPSHP